ncbi:MAG: mobile mystery protein B [Bacteroidota bacterium]
MGLELEYLPGQTPLDEEEKEGLLIKTITTRGELDEFEQQNIEKAIEWTIAKRFKPEKIFTEEFVCGLHRKMFGDVWKWAGQFRRSNKNLGCDWHKIGTSLKQLNGDAAYWFEKRTYPEEELAIRYKHQIVSIHCFSNGNGRHSRLMGDVIINHIFGKQVFSWGGTSINKKGEARDKYLKAVRQADNGELKPLIEFART